MKLPEEPRPVPAGMSAMLVISSRRSSQLDQLQRLADQRVLDVLDPLDLLHLRILEEDPRHEPVMQQDVDVLVDRRGDEEAAVLLVVRRQVGPAAAEGDAERAAGHDHFEGLWPGLRLLLSRR